VFKIPSWNKSFDLQLSWKLVYDHERVIHTKRVTQTALEGKTPEEIAAALKELPPDQLAKTLGESNLQGF